MKIKTERLLIRKVAANDWEGIKRIWDDFQASEYAKYDVPHKSDADEIKSQVSKWENANQGEKHLFFAVCLENEVIGLAFSLRSDGWYLRSDIIWQKGNAMPENVKDRPTRSYEHVFLFSKSRRYYYDALSIAEPTVTKHKNIDNSNFSQLRNCRDVWSINTVPYKGEHFAAYPPKLAERCILAGCPEDFL